MSRRRRRVAGLTLAALALAAAATPQAVLSAADEPTDRVDPDCVRPEEAAKLPEAPDGVCPETEGGGAPVSPPEPTQPPTPKPPGPPPPAEGDAVPTPVTSGQQPGQGGAQEDEAASEPAELETTAHRRRGRRDSRPDAERRPHRKARARRGGRRRGRGGRRHRRGSSHGGRRADRGRDRHAAGSRVLGPIPAWARHLLSRPLPDPIPSGKRLHPGFARSLASTAAEHRVSWPLLLAILRARGRDGSAPAGAAEVERLARRLARGGQEERFPERVLALSAYHRAVGLRGLVRGLGAVKPALIHRVLGSEALQIYPGGRADLKAGRIDGRVLVLLLYLSHRHRAVTVSSLQTGHGFFTKSGNVSNHSFGRAVDIAALGGVSILGHQDPGGVTERALRGILLLPKEMWPSELISLFDMGGPSFAMADHADHIHAGF